ncbi:hypothetical protein [Methylocella sp. CPCC 101449]|uniref:hypothetical protein n=1 Tax=Methylocella sp. CPCC 101449 TaxID=2987531 RepID=UPI00289248F2|nr:hypothetical protein [Methylocella sp. CPCC 101449]MDT2023027.1 hypothetical protein [Methylocella sp. CPCC 101449]
MRISAAFILMLLCVGVAEAQGPLSKDTMQVVAQAVTLMSDTIKGDRRSAITCSVKKSVDEQAECLKQWVARAQGPYKAVVEAIDTFRSAIDAPNISAQFPNLLPGYDGLAKYFKSSWTDLNYCSRQATPERQAVCLASWIAQTKDGHELVQKIAGAVLADLK